MQGAMGQRFKTERTLRRCRMMRIACADEPFFTEVFGNQIKRRHLKKRGDGRPDDDEVPRSFAIVKTLPQASECALIFRAASLLKQNTACGNAAFRHCSGQLLMQFMIGGGKLCIIAILGVLPAPQQCWRENAKKDFIREPEPVGNQSRAINGGALKNQCFPLGANTLKKPSNPSKTLLMILLCFLGVQRQLCVE